MPRAVIADSIGPYNKVLRLTQGSDLTPLPSGALHIRVSAAGVSFPDLLMVEGKYQKKATPPFVPVESMVGEVIGVGPDVLDWRIGDRVVGSAVVGPSGHMCGGLSDEALMNAKTANRVPQGISDEIALAMHENYWFVHHAVSTCGEVSNGDTMLVLGASGACGLAAIDLGKAFGAKVIACASTPSKLEVCKAAGADLVVDYESGGADGFLGRLKEAGVYGKVSVVYDPVGGSYGEVAFRAMAPKGRYVVFGFASGGTDPKSAFPKFPINLLLMRGQKIIGSFGASRGDAITKMFGMVQEGKLKPAQGSTYLLEDFMQAFDDMANRKVTGKVIVSMANATTTRSKL